MFFSKAILLCYIFMGYILFICGNGNCIFQIFCSGVLYSTLFSIDYSFPLHI